MQANLNIGGLIADLDKQTQKNLQKAALFLKLEVQNKIGRTQPITRTKGKSGVWFHGDSPSLPGEPPKKVTGDLFRSITAAKEPDKWIVGSVLPKAGYLELGTSKMDVRPYLAVTMKEKLEQIQKILKEGFE